MISHLASSMPAMPSLWWPRCKSKIDENTLDVSLVWNGKTVISLFNYFRASVLFVNVVYFTNGGLGSILLEKLQLMSQFTNLTNSTENFASVNAALIVLLRTRLRCLFFFRFEIVE